AGDAGKRVALSFAVGDGARSDHHDGSKRDDSFHQSCRQRRVRFFRGGSSGQERYVAATGAVARTVPGGGEAISRERSQEIELARGGNPWVAQRWGGDSDRSEFQRGGPGRGDAVCGVYPRYYGTQTRGTRAPRQQGTVPRGAGDSAAAFPEGSAES